MSVALECPFQALPMAASAPTAPLALAVTVAVAVATSLRLPVQSRAEPSRAAELTWAAAPPVGSARPRRRCGRLAERLAEHHLANESCVYNLPASSGAYYSRSPAAAVHCSRLAVDCCRLLATGGTGAQVSRRC